MAVEKTFNGNTYNSDTSFAEYKYITALLTMAGDIMVEADARSGAIAQFTFAAGTDDGDPGAGALRLNAATQSAATQIYVDLLDADGIDVSGLLAAFADSGSATRGWLMLRQRNDRTKWLAFRLTAVTAASGYRRLSVSPIAASAASPFAVGASLLLAFAPAGDRGWPADGFRWSFSTGTADADPGAGVLRLNNATQNAATEAYIDLVDADGATQTAWLDGFDDASGSRKGRIRLTAQGDPARFLSLALTAVTMAAGYRKLAFAVLSSSGPSPFADGEPLFLAFQPAGDAGDVAGPASSTDHGLATWNGAGGSALRSTGWTVDPASGVMTAGGTLEMGGQTLRAGFTAVGAAGEVSTAEASATGGVVVLHSRGAPILRDTLGGNRTYEVAGALTPGREWQAEVRVVQDGSGGRSVTILPLSRLTRSADLSDTTLDAGWDRGSVGIVEGPAGTPSGYQATLTATGGHALHYIQSRRGNVVSPDFKATGAILVKAGASSRVSMQVRLDTYAHGGSVDADLSSGTITGTGTLGSGSVLDCGMIDAGGGWYVLWASVDTASTVADLIVTVHLLNTGGNTPFTPGDPAESVLFGGACCYPGASYLGFQNVGATRAGMVRYRDSGDVIDFPSQPAFAASRMLIASERDGVILIDDVSLAG